MESVKLSDIALALNISQSTVSRALRNKSGVSPQMREKIFKMAQDLNYPFKLPKDQGFKRIGIIIPDLSNQFFATVCYGIESVLRVNGYLTYLANTDEDWELERDYVSSFIYEEMKGLIIAPTANGEEIYRKHLGTLPIIFFDRKHPSLNVQSVLIDNEDVIFRALRYLVDMGHTSICFVSGNQLLYTGQARTAGFLEAIETFGLDPEHCPIVAGNFKGPEAYEATKIAFKEHGFTAVIAASNKTTSGVLGALRDLNLSIPTDVSVIGFDDQEWMEFNQTPITTVIQPAFSMGTLVASLLLQQIQGNSSSESVVLRAEIEHRKSVLSIPK